MYGDSTLSSCAEVRYQQEQHPSIQRAFNLDTQNTVEGIRRSFHIGAPQCLGESDWRMNVLKL